MAADAPAAFVSYCRDDSDFALRLAKDLKDTGAVVWIDQLDIEPGQDWDIAIEKAVQECPRMLLILSAASVQSRNVRNEITFALDERKTIIPVLYQDCTVPLQLRRVQHIDFRSEYSSGLKTLLKALVVQRSAPVTTAASPGREETQPAVSDSRAAPARDLKLHELRTLKVQSGFFFQRVTGVAVTPDGQVAVSASDQKALKVWELASGRELRSLAGHGGSVNAVAVTPDGQVAVSASNDGTLKMWDLASGRELRTCTSHSDGFTHEVSAVAVTADGQRLVSGSADGKLKVWDRASGHELRSDTGHSHRISAVAVTPEGQRAVSASFDRTLKVWDLASGGTLPLTGHSDRVNAVAVTPDGELTVSASADQTLKVWDLASGRELRTIAGHTGEVTAVAVTPDGQWAISASFDHTLRVWELSNGRELTALKANAYLQCCAVSPDGRTILAGDGQGVIHCLRLEEP